MIRSTRFVFCLVIKRGIADRVRTQERIDKQREEALQLRAAVAKATSRQDFAEERYQELVKTAEAQTNEVKSLRTRNSELSSSIVAHQQVFLFVCHTWIQETQS